jgi:hypothetical protein
MVIDDLATFRTTIELESPEQPGYHVPVHDVVIDGDAGLSWIPAHLLEELGVARRKIRRFRHGDGTHISRSTGYVILHVAGAQTNDEVVFAELGDVAVLGRRSLEGLNLKLEPVTQRLVDAGPAMVAAALVNC